MEETTQPASVGLTRIVIEGYKSIRQCDLELRPLNILIGANGAGKSNFLSVFAFLDAFINSSLDRFVELGGGADVFLLYGRKQTPTVSLMLHSLKQVYECKLEASATNRLSLSEDYKMKLVADYLASIQSKGLKNVDSIQQSYYNILLMIHETKLYKPELSDETNLKIIESLFTKPLISALTKNYQKTLWQQYHFHDTGSSSPLKLKQQLNDNLRLAADGRNIAAFLYLLQEKHPAAYRQIRDTVRLVAPFFDDFILRPDPFNENYIQLEWRERGRPDFPFMAHQLSDGTLRFIGLVTALLQPPELRPPVILIDEPELGLHPYALSVLADLMRATSASTQIIVSTQSVELLNEFEPEDVIVVDREGGESKLRRLGADELKDWLEDYTLGELWTKNIFGGRPSR